MFFLNCVSKCTMSDHAFRHLWFGNQFILLIYFTLANMTRLMTSLQLMAKLLPKLLEIRPN